MVVLRISQMRIRAVYLRSLRMIWRTNGWTKTTAVLDQPLWSKWLSIEHAIPEADAVY
jgi:hypothetical protein